MLHKLVHLSGISNEERNNLDSIKKEATKNKIYNKRQSSVIDAFKSLLQFP